MSGFGRLLFSVAVAVASAALIVLGLQTTKSGTAKPTPPANKQIVPQTKAENQKSSAAPTPEQVEVDSVVYRIPLGQVCGASSKSASLSDQLAALRADFAVSPTQRFATAFQDNRPVLEGGGTQANGSDALARTLLSIRLARDLDLIDAIIAAHAKPPRGRFDEAFRAHANDLKAAAAVDWRYWRSGDLDAKQKAALTAVMEAHGLDVAGAFKRTVEDLIDAGRYDPDLSPKVKWEAIETKEQSEWASRARWQYARRSEPERRALCAILVAAYKDNARAHARVASPSTAAKPATPAKPVIPVVCRTKACEAVLLIVEPSTATNREVEDIRKELETQNFRVRVVNTSENESEIQADVVVKMDLMAWRSGMTMSSRVGNSYEVILPKLNKRNKWEVRVYLGEAATMSTARRFVEAERSVVPWILENLVP